MRRGMWVLLVALLAVSGFTLRAAQDNEIKELKDMIRAQNAKIERLERSQSAAATTGVVDKAVASRGDCYLAPDRPCINGVGLSFTGEYLYWKTNATQNTYAYLGDTWGVGGSQGTLGKAQNIDTDWSSGFRLGLDYKLPYDGWNIGADYTYYRADGSDSVSDTAATPAITLYPANSFGAVPAMGHAAANADFSFDRVNFEIGRNTKVSETLSVRFFGGASVLWMDAETKHSFYTLGAPIVGLGYHNEAEVDATYYGIRAGLDAEMKLKHGFSLLGKAAGSILTGELNASTVNGIDANADGILAVNETLGNTRNSTTRVVPGVELEAGVAWERKVLCNLNLKVFLGYQLSDYIGAGERLDADAVSAFSGTSRVVNREHDLMLHGLVFRLKLDF